MGGGMIPQNRIMVLDVETASFNSAVYDVGYTIATVKGEILQARNWLVKEIFTNAGLMMDAFFAKKMFTHYAEMLQNGVVKLTPWCDIVNAMRLDCMRYNVNILAAYNLAFDRRVMANTHKGMGYSTPILPNPLKQLDLWRFACESKLDSWAYREIAVINEWVSEAGNIFTKAEHAYRYISGDWDFDEDHTALSDAIIETEIMAACYRAHKTVPYNIVDNQAWRIVNPNAPRW